jgi:hypothetical protein
VDTPAGITLCPSVGLAGDTPAEPGRSDAPAQSDSQGVTMDIQKVPIPMSIQLIIDSQGSLKEYVALSRMLMRVVSAVPLVGRRVPLCRAVGALISCIARQALRAAQWTRP